MPQRRLCGIDALVCLILGILFARSLLIRRNPDFRTPIGYGSMRILGALPAVVAESHVPLSRSSRIGRDDRSRNETHPVAFSILTFVRLVVINTAFGVSSNFHATFSG